MGNIFVLCTGRCGSMTFSKACQHITNFTSGHETRSTLYGTSRLDYPDNHIEVDCRLVFFLGQLERLYPDAKYVHLTRNRHNVAQSLLKRHDRRKSITKAYLDAIKMMPTGDKLRGCYDYIDTVTANIEQFIKDKDSMTLDIDRMNFQRFFKWIGAKGDINACLSEFGNRYNAS